MAQLNTRIALRNDSLTNWTEAEDVVLLKGEIGIAYCGRDVVKLKIGDGIKAWKDLKWFGGDIDIAADGKSIVVDSGQLKIAGFDSAAAGAYLVKGVDGELEWAIPSTGNIEGLQDAIDQLQEAVTKIENVLFPTSGDGALLSRIEKTEEDVSSIKNDLIDLKEKMDGTGDGSVASKIDAKIEAFASRLTDDGKINTLMELIQYVENHGVEAAELVKAVENLQTLVGTTSVNEQVMAAVGALRAETEALYEKVKYEISDKPEGAIVDYRDAEIRLMCPNDTQWVLQNSGENADEKLYYIGFKAYAPANATGFKEDMAEIIADQTMYSFEDNDFAGVDKYGRKYSVVWLPVAKYDETNDEWTYHGASSTKDHYVGWYYSVEWYDAKGKLIETGTTRINLSNEGCHYVNEPYYMSSVIKQIGVNGALLNVVDHRVDITTKELIKSGDEIVVNEDGTLGVKAIDFSKITSDGATTVVLNGGSASV